MTPRLTQDLDHRIDPPLGQGADWPPADPTRSVKPATRTARGFSSVILELAFVSRLRPLVETVASTALEIDLRRRGHCWSSSAIAGNATSSASRFSTVTFGAAVTMTSPASSGRASAAGVGLRSAGQRLEPPRDADAAPGGLRSPRANRGSSAPSTSPVAVTCGPTQTRNTPSAGAVGLLSRANSAGSDQGGDLRSAAAAAHRRQVGPFAHCRWPSTSCCVTRDRLLVSS